MKYYEIVGLNDAEIKPITYIVYIPQVALNWKNKISLSLILSNDIGFKTVNHVYTFILYFSTPETFF